MAGPFRSKLIPFEDEIRELRARNVSYREIATELQKRHGLKAHPDTVNSFVIVRAKRPMLVHTLPPKAGAVEKIPKVAARPTLETSTADGWSERAVNFFEAPTPPQSPKNGPKWAAKL